MEDAHSVHLHFAQDPDSAYFAVFDGHGGSKFAQYCGSQLHHCLQRDPAFSKTVHVHIYIHHYVCEHSRLCAYMYI